MVAGKITGNWHRVLRPGHRPSFLFPRVVMNGMESRIIPWAGSCWRGGVGSGEMVSERSGVRNGSRLGGAFTIHDRWSIVGNPVLECRGMILGDEVWNVV